MQQFGNTTSAAKRSDPGSRDLASPADFERQDAAWLVEPDTRYMPSRVDNFDSAELQTETALVEVSRGS